MDRKEGAAPKPDDISPGERLADNWEAFANRREQVADERDREADERDREADERDREADEREKHLDEMAGELGALAAMRRRHALDAIERSRGLLAASGARLDRSEAALRRAAARAEREQAEIDRAVAQGERDLTRQLPDPGAQIEHAKALRKRLSETAAALVATEETVAQVHDKLAARKYSVIMWGSWTFAQLSQRLQVKIPQVHRILTAAQLPERASDHRRAADKARQAANRAREVERRFAD